MSSSIDRSKVKIFSLGIIFRLDNNTTSNLVAYQELLVKQIDSIYEKFNQDLRDTLLDELSKNIESTDKSLVWKEPFKVLKDIGQLYLPLWKQLIWR